MFWNRNSEKVIISNYEKKQIIREYLENQTPPLTAKQFIEKYRRGYLNYASLIDTAFGGSHEKDYEKLSDEDRTKVVAYARDFCKNAFLRKGEDDLSFWKEEDDPKASQEQQNTIENLIKNLDKEIPSFG